MYIVICCCISLISAKDCYPDHWWVPYVNNECYYFSGVESSPQALTWHEARRWCLENGADLVSIHDSTTQRFIEGQVIGILALLCFLPIQALIT